MHKDRDNYHKTLDHSRISERSPKPKIRGERNATTTLGFTNHSNPFGGGVRQWLFKDSLRIKYQEMKKRYKMQQRSLNLNQQN